MATILKFEARRAVEHSGALAQSAGDEERRGDVVIFPGVRIEREGFLLSDRLDGPGGKGSRGRRRRGGD